MPPIKREMINAVHAWATELKKTHNSKNTEFAGYAPIAPPKKGFNPFGRARRSYKAEQYRLFHSPAVQAALQDWKHAIETERTAQISIVNMHNRRPDEREIRNSMDRINEKKVAAIKAMEDLRKGFNKIRGKV